MAESCSLGLERPQYEFAALPKSPQASGEFTNRKENVETWDPIIDQLNIRETVEWIESDDFSITLEELKPWMEKGPMKSSPNDETHFCAPKLLENILKKKQEVFEKFDSFEVSKARTRANPFETIKSVFFMNRAALKMANIDAATDFMFTEIDRDPAHRKAEGTYYFADVCAGPGGFTEYVLWRKQWSFKGFGLTLKGKHDFRLHDSTCSSGATFQSYYGSADDGNICNPDNIKDFSEKVLFETDNLGVHFVMADGGFSVEGQENLQEILSKQLYICQCLMALEIVRKHGHFVTKLFDTFTLFSVGLLFLMHQCFAKVCILKPNSSRPANSERYLVCSGLKDDIVVKEIRKYLRLIVEELWNLKSGGNETHIDINSIVPLEFIKEHSRFNDYMINCNNRLGTTQIKNLLKLSAFCHNSSLTDIRQEKFRKDCLTSWRIPDKSRVSQEPFTIDDLLTLAIRKPAFLHVKPNHIISENDLSKVFTDLSDWHYSALYCCRTTNTCTFYASIGGSKVYRLQNHKWTKVKNLQFIKGTLLFGEMVVENTVQTGGTNESQKKSLHIIDAIRLGDINIIDLPFVERLSLIRTYAKAINFETTDRFTRIRPKWSDYLINIAVNSEIRYNKDEDQYISVLPPIGYNSLKEYFYVNSILFLKTNENQFFNTTYVLRAQLFIDSLEIEPSESNNLVTYETLIKYIRSRV